MYQYPCHRSAKQTIGAVGIEFAAEIKHLIPRKRVVLVHSRQILLSNESLPVEFKELTRETLHNSGVELCMGVRVTADACGDDSYTILRLSDGTHLKSGLVLYTVGRQSPQTSFLPPAAINADGFVVVKPSLVHQIT
jgi:NADH dehydrogenase FAD-containing subunit